MIYSHIERYSNRILDDAMNLGTIKDQDTVLRLQEFFKTLLIKDKQENKGIFN